MSAVVSPLAGLLGAKNLLKTPTPPEAIAPAKTSSPAVQQAVSEATQRRSKARGWQSTILSQMGQGSDLKQTFGS